MIHECRNVGNHFICAACAFTGNLEEAVAHAYKNQFEVKYDPSNAKLGGASDVDKYPRKLSNVRSKRQRKYNLVPRDNGDRQENRR